VTDSADAAATGAATPTTPVKGADVDLEKAGIDTVLATLSSNRDSGLTAAESASRLSTYGPNGLPDHAESVWHKVLKNFTGPIAYMIEAAAIVSGALQHWEDFGIIVALLLFNAVLGYWQDSKAANALAALKAGLAPDATVLRDGKWSTIAAADLVPGDIVKIRLGEVVPADLRLTDDSSASIDQSALTGESVPVRKHQGDAAYSGSIVKQGETTGVVIATGSNTFFGRTATLVAGAGSVSHAQKAMFQIGNFLIAVAVILAVVLVLFEVFNDFGTQWSGTADDNLTKALGIVQFVLVLLVASIPVAMPAVFSVTMALGALALSKQKAIVARLESIEEMAGVDILCSDKTGTLTKNQLTLGDPILVGATDPADVILAGALASRAEDHDAIDDAVIAGLADATVLTTWTQHRFTPFDPVSKYTKAEVTDPDGRNFTVAKGAPAAIVALAGATGADADTVTSSVADLASHGNRALAVARSADDGASWTILGVLPMFDPPRDDSLSTIEQVRAKGVQIKMITGDDTAIAVETARQLKLGTNIMTASDVFPPDMDPDNVPPAVADAIEKADGFARVFPEHKYAIVKSLQQRGHLVAMTGDGVNDAPALKQADCGTAVSGATDAARGAAALILTAPGLSVINSAIDEARRIFGRVTSYTIYRVALTIDIMFLVVLATLILGFQPLTAVMIVIISLLDDVPIMTIAYDNTPVSKRPIRWRMPRILATSAVLGFASVVQSLGLFFFVWGMTRLGDGTLGMASWHGTDGTAVDQIQTAVFLQLVTGGHLLIFVTRAERWFFLRPFPSWPLVAAITGTQILAVLMAGFGWLMKPLPWEMVGVVLAYCVVWVFVMGAVRLGTERHLDHGFRWNRLGENDITRELRPPMLRPHQPRGEAPAAAAATTAPATTASA